MEVLQFFGLIFALVGLLITLGFCFSAGSYAFDVFMLYMTNDNE